MERGNIEKPAYVLLLYHWTLDIRHSIFKSVGTQPTTYMDKTPRLGEETHRNRRVRVARKGGGMDLSGVQEGLRKKIESPETIDPGVLQVLDYDYRLKRDIEIKTDQPEFTSICPISGLPDLGCITIRYTPRDNIVELKSLKYYLLQYRNVGIFYEHLVNRILEDLVSCTRPKFMEVTGTFTPRGGITTTARVEYRGEAV
jgi:7-cyano-7-deazaguanine reductase